MRHHLIDVAEPNEGWSLTQFQQAAQEAILDIHKREQIPILVGGSGQYIRSVTEGWLPPKLAPKPELREAIQKWGAAIGVEQLHSKLALIDAKAASRMDARNMRRIVRAFEVIFASGKLFSEQSQATGSAYQLIQIGMMRDREELYQRIDLRVEAMLKTGWLDEVQALLKRGYDAKLPSMSAIGYAQLIAHIEGKIEMDEAIQIIKKKSRNFVRRQANWFKQDDPEIRWFQAGENRFGEIISSYVLERLKQLVDNRHN